MSESSSGPFEEVQKAEALSESESGAGSDLDAVLVLHAFGGSGGEVEVGTSKSDGSPSLLFVELDPLPNLAFSFSSESEVGARVNRGSADRTFLLLEAVDPLVISHEVEPESEVSVKVEVFFVEILSGNSVSPPESPSLLRVGVVARESRPVRSEVVIVPLRVGVPEFTIIRVIRDFRLFGFLASL